MPRPTAPSRPLRRFAPAPLDVAITIVLTVFVVGVTAIIAHWHGHSTVVGPDISGSGIVWLIAGVLPILERRAFPLVTFLLSAALVISYYDAGMPGGPSAVVPVFLLVSLAYHRGPIVAAAAAATGCVGIAIPVAVRNVAELGQPWVFGVLVVGLAAVAIGTAGRTQRAARMATRARTEAEDQRRVEEERLRIAREVHDVVAHSLAMINVQAGVAAHVADRRPEQAKAALLAIKEASRTALADLRATLNVLRSGEGRAPTPGLHQLPDLIATASSAGLTVTATGEADALPAPVDVAAYRIVQESLTNVVRHAEGADTVGIEFLRTPGELSITITDNGHGATPKPGNGLRGMAERAQALGGSATAGPAQSGGFVVQARLPLNNVGGGDGT
ncbi:MAG TPA: sensor histidine kinase [Pseudonocardiaceae bacterium]|jgi:signal transduction histidine kinase|nr:sensor histidine kinase [Pseudonocardiaceae bacterium]